MSETPVSTLHAGVCTPGEHGVPGSLLGKLICGTWAPRTPSAWAHLLDLWPYAATGLAAVIVAIVAWQQVRRIRWARTNRDAVFLEIVPPVGVSPEHTAKLWLFLVNQLRASKRFTLTPRRLIFEVYARGDRMRLGVLVPPELNPLSVRRAIGRAWRDARVEQAAASVLPSGLPVRGRVAALRQPDWLPFTDPGTTDSDDLHAVFDALAAAGRAGGALLRVSVCRAPAHRVKGFALAGRDPAKAARRRTGTASAVDLAVRGIRWALLGVINLLHGLVTTGHGQTHSSRTGAGPQSPLADPFQAERAKLARIKGGTPPHLLVGVQVFAAAETAAAARAGVLDIAGGYPAVSAELRWRRIIRAASRATDRWIPEAAMVLATTAETAALAGLPAEPSLYGLPAASSRHRPTTNDTFRTSGRGTENPRHTSESDDDNLDPWGLA